MAAAFLGGKPTAPAPKQQSFTPPATAATAATAASAATADTPSDDDSDDGGDDDSEDERAQIRATYQVPTRPPRSPSWLTMAWLTMALLNMALLPMRTHARTCTAVRAAWLLGHGRLDDGDRAAAAAGRGHELPRCGRPLVAP